MSYKVLVIPEDFTKDEHILKPLIERILADCGHKATVQVCRDPNFQGVHAALDIHALRTRVLPLYPMVDLFILFIDRDGKPGRKVKTELIESTLSAELADGRHFLAETAWQEAEIFILAGHDLAPGCQWREVRADA